MSTFLFALAAVAASAHAATPDDTDRGHLWVRQSAAIAGWPTGALSDSRAQLRTPLHRSESVLFQDTVAGIGARARISPAFSEAGVHATIAPIAIFDVNLFVGGITYWDGGFAPLPTSERGGTLPDSRAARAGENVATRGMVVSAQPTLKAKVGRVIVFDSWTIRQQRLSPTSAETAQPWVYEPFSDLVLAWEDTTFEHQPGVLVDIVPDEGGAWLRVGGTMRDRWSLETGDRSAAAGALVATKPGASKAVPTIAAMGLAYVIDDERVGATPYVGLQAAWSFTRGLRRAGPAPVASL
jgi:hypothetical protein